MNQKKILHLIASIALSILSVIIVAVNLPPSYGKTQFIVGYDGKIPTVPAPESQSFLTTISHHEGHSAQVFFAPDDDVRQALLDLIAHEKVSIRVAAYALTDKIIAQALLDAYKTGVKVEVVADQSSLKGMTNRVAWLHNHGIPVHVYVGIAPISGMSNIMHNKFMIFGQNVGDKSVLVTGSYNYTNSAQKHNQENVIVLNDAQVIERYAQQFLVLKQRCVPCEKILQNRQEKPTTYANQKRTKNSTRLTKKGREVEAFA